MPLPIAPTPVLEGKSIAWFLRRLKAWEKSKTPMRDIPVDHAALDKALEEIRAKRKLRS